MSVLIHFYMLWCLNWNFFCFFSLLLQGCRFKSLWESMLRTLWSNSVTMAKYGFTWAVSTCTLIAALLSAIGFFIHIVGFSCPEWWVGPGEERSPFISIGWHQACFEDCRFPYCPGGDYGTVYDGCYRWTFNEWLWDDERIRELREWFLPGQIHITKARTPCSRFRVHIRFREHLRFRFQVTVVSVSASVSWYDA